MILSPKHLRKHNPTLFIECLATEIVKTYKYLVGIIEDQEKQSLQRWWQNSDFWRFLIINISKLCHRIIIVFFPEEQAIRQLLIELMFVSLTFFKKIFIIQSLNPSFACSKVLFFGSFWRSFWINYWRIKNSFLHSSLV